MHIYFSGIGGTGIGPLALIAHKLGWKVSGSDKQNSAYIDYLRNHGINDIHIGQSKEQIEEIHNKNPIDWFVYTAALTIEQHNPPELEFCKEQDIRSSKRDEFINLIVKENNLKLIGIAGTHGKTTTTAMVVYLFRKLGIPISYTLPAKTSFAEMGDYEKGAEYFVYEADEFDRNFLNFEPFLSLISGVTWDHHEIFVTREDYQLAFKEYIDQSQHTYIWQDDADYLGLANVQSVTVLDPTKVSAQDYHLKGLYNRLDAHLAVQTLHRLTDKPLAELVELINHFPGLQRRMEMIVPNLYSDYAHTPEKVRGAMSVALEMAAERKQDVVILYEPLTNRRQHYMIDVYKDSFNGASKVYWLPSYLAREDPNQRIIDPAELIAHLSDPSIAEPAERNEELINKINRHLEKGDMVVGMAGGGGDSLDDWLRTKFKAI